ncbi:MAG: serine hydrolase, partial [Rhodospirillaceae bacterium]
IDPKYGSLGPEDVFALCCAPVKSLATLEERRERLSGQIEQSRAAANMAAISERLQNDPALWFGAASPREMGRLLESIQTGTAASPESCEEMRRILLGQKSGELKIPHYLSVPVGHKTGETGDVTNDVGIIYAKSGPIVISFYNMNVVGMRAETEELMGEVARTVVDYFDGAD